MTPFSNRLAGLLVLGLSAFALAASLFVDKAVSPHPEGSNPPNVQTTIEVSRLEKLLPADKNPQRYLDVFMMKGSKDAGKRDFSICIFIRGKDGKDVCIDRDYSESRFQAQSSNYVQWLYHQKVQVKDIPHSYLIDLEQKTLTPGSLIRISISPLPGFHRPPFAHFLRAGMHTEQTLDSQPVCPCPPGPCTNCPGYFESSPSFFVKHKLQEQYKIPLETRTQ